LFLLTRSTPSAPLFPYTTLFRSCRAIVSVSGYLIGNQETGKAPLHPSAELSWWYQFYFATERGRAGYGTYRRESSADGCKGAMRSEEHTSELQSLAYLVRRLLLE